MSELISLRIESMKLYREYRLGKIVQEEYRRLLKLIDKKIDEQELAMLTGKCL